MRLKQLTKLLRLSGDFGDAIALVWLVIVLVVTAIIAVLLAIIAHLLGYPFWYGVLAAIALGALLLWWSRG